MKRRFLVPLLLIGAPITIGVADAAIHIAGCSLGNQGACAELARRKQHSEKLAAKPKQVTVATAQEVQQQSQDVSDEQPSSTVVGKPMAHNLAIGCIVLASRGLKDPASFRQLSNLNQVQATGLVEFTATNGFGGRVRSVFDCRTNTYID